MADWGEFAACQPSRAGHDGDVDPEQVLGEQLAYYRARAGEYDRWFVREGRYDRGRKARQMWFSELEQVRAALSAVPLDGADVVELAAGTGIWTDVLAGRAAYVTAVDASPEMIELNRRRLAGAASPVSFGFCRRSTATAQAAANPGGPAALELIIRGSGAAAQPCRAAPTAVSRRRDNCELEAVVSQIVGARVHVHCGYMKGPPEVHRGLAGAGSPRRLAGQRARRYRNPAPYPTRILPARPGS